MIFYFMSLFALSDYGSSSGVMRKDCFKSDVQTQIKNRLIRGRFLFRYHAAETEFINNFNIKISSR